MWPGGAIDLSSPVEWSHPLNAGRVAWWLGVPGWAGGATLPDLCRRANATRVNAPAWGGAPQGFSALTLNGSNQYAATPAFGFNYDLLTVSAWVRPSSLSGRYTVIDLGQDGTNVPEVEVGATGGEAAAVSVLVPGTFVAATVSGVLTAGAWTHIVYTKNGTQAGHAVYVNGVAAALSTSVAQTYAGTSAAKSLGARASSSQCFPGALGWVSLWSRPLSAGEVWADYAQALRGHPDTLRRLSRRAWLFAGTSPPPPPAYHTWYAGRGAALGGGAL